MLNANEFDLPLYLSHSKSCIAFLIQQCKHGIMSTCVYSIRLEDRVRKIMDEMPEVNWQAEIKQLVERMIREKKKQRLLAEAQDLWTHQKPNTIGAAKMIRADRDA